MGRYYAMDRDKNWDRVKKAYDVLTKAEGEKAESACAGIQASYDKEVNDEFVVPFYVEQDGKPVATIQDGDSVIFFNFRPDRAREITRAFCADEFDGFAREKRLDLTYVCFTEYDETIPNKEVAFHKVSITNTFGEFLAAHNMTQARIAETEKYYMFNEHGQMLYEWIDGKAVEQGSNAQLDGNLAKGELATTSVMRYYNEVEDGSRGNGWYQIDGAEDLDADGDTDWYYIDDGEVKYADGGSKDFATYDDDGAVYVQRIKVEGKYFAFNEKGQMQDGLQYCQADGGFYYFDDNGYQKTGRVTSVENDDDDYTFYFNTKNGKNGLGYNGLKDDYLYFNGKRLDADDDYRLYYYDGDIYLTNTKGKVQKTSKKYDIENKGIAEDDVKVEISGKKVVSVTLASGKTIKAEDLIADAEAQFGKDVVTEDQIVSVPFIQLYDDDIYTYTDLVGTKAVEGWLGLNK